MKHSKTDIQQYLRHCQQRVNKLLEQKLPSVDKEPKVLHKAMNYAVLNGGKRIRAALVYASAEAAGEASPHTLDAIAGAIEIVHASSLVHDDLPAIDNDDLRRGMPTCHRVFGEATAILTGDALQVLAFELIINLNQRYLADNTKVKIIKLFSKSIGSFGLIGGEELDTKMTDTNSVTIEQLEHIYKLKTACLIEASILFGVIAANCCDEQVLNNLKKFGEHIGLAFQIHDDIIGIESDTKTLGKKQGADLLLNKPVYPVIAGMKKAKEMQVYYYESAMAHLSASGIEKSKLIGIAEYIIARNY